MEFLLSDNNDIGCGTFYQGEIDLIPKNVVKTFGKPNIGDDYKVSGEYVFAMFTSVFDDEVVFTLYDWKWTTLYDKNNPFTPKGLWMLDKPLRFNIGGNSRSAEHLSKFKLYLNSTVDSKC